MRDDLAMLDTVDTILRDAEALPDGAEDSTIAGALVIGWYVDPDGTAAGYAKHAIGGMHHYTQIGVLDDCLRALRGE